MSALNESLSEYVYAGFWRRLTATILDFSILFAFLLPLFILNEGIPFSVQAFVDHWIFNVSWCVSLIVFWSISGASPGKYLVGCKIVKLNPDNSVSELTFKTAILRVVCYIVSALPLYLGFVWIAFHKQKRSFHDLILGTIVIMETENYEDIPLTTLMAPFTK